MPVARGRWTFCKALYIFGIYIGKLQNFRLERTNFKQTKSSSPSKQLCSICNDYRKNMVQRNRSGEVDFSTLKKHMEIVIEKSMSIKYRKEDQ